jgi:hypothetical protein
MKFTAIVFRKSTTRGPYLAILRLFGRLLVMAFFNTTEVCNTNFGAIFFPHESFVLILQK